MVVMMENWVIAVCGASTAAPSCLRRCIDRPDLLADAGIILPLRRVNHVTSRGTFPVQTEPDGADAAHPSLRGVDRLQPGYVAGRPLSCSNLSGDLC